MQRVISSSKYLVRNIKNIARQSWVEQPEDAHVPFENRQKDHLNIKYYRDVKRELKTSVDQQQVRPISPKMGPITIKNPKIFNKKYRWCACGQSLSQPFCDGSHEGTAFTPFRFTFEESVKQINLCGCKLTQNKPFCDGQSCKKQNNSN